MDDFQSTPISDFSPSLFPWCVVLLTSLLPWTQSSSWRQNFPCSLCAITNSNLSSFRHHVMMTSFLICSILFYPICCHFSSRIWESGFSWLHCQTIAVVFSHGIGAFSCPPFLFPTHCHPWLLFFQVPGNNLLTSFAKYFSDPCCLIHYQSLQYCAVVERLFCGLCWYTNHLRFLEDGVFHTRHLWTTMRVSKWLKKPPKMCLCVYFWVLHKTQKPRSWSLALCMC